MQLDLRIEAANLNRFRSNFASERSLRERVCFPEPIQPFVAEAVLVETYVHGRPVKEYADADIDTRTELSRVGVQAGVATLDSRLHPVGRAFPTLPWCPAGDHEDDLPRQFPAHRPASG